MELPRRFQHSGRPGNYHLKMLFDGKFAFCQHEPPWWPEQAARAPGTERLCALWSYVSVQHLSATWRSCWSHLILYFVFQPKERGSTRVHALNNVNRVLQVLHQNSVSLQYDFWGSLVPSGLFIAKPATCSVHWHQLILGSIFLLKSIKLFLRVKE